MKTHFAMMADYNSWANARVYDAAAALPDEVYRRDHDAFFGSIHGTLNHIMVGDRVWMSRFTGSGDAPKQLDVVLFEDLDALRAERKAEDARISTYIGGLTDADLGGRISFRTLTNPADVEQPLAPALTHFFNHQTHHRGQVHCLLTQLAGEAPVLDLIQFQRETGSGMA